MIMNKNDILTIDAQSKKPPFFKERDSRSLDKAFITGEVKTKDNEVWECEVINITSSGNYTVRLTEKIH